MGLKRVWLLYLALWISGSHSINDLKPWDKELIYNWKTLVKAGTDLPTPHASQFMLEGKIRIQFTDNATLVKMEDLTYKLYNGMLDRVHEYDTHSVPVQIEELEKPFKIIHDTDGLAAGIVTNDKEHDFSRNMKKAMATILQLDTSVYKNLDPHHLQIFIVKEKSIYGDFEVDYTIGNNQNGEIMVSKTHLMQNPRHLYQQIVSNHENSECDIGPENPLSHTSKKDYHIVKQDDRNIVKKITTIGALNYQPFKAQSDHQFILVNQTLELDRMVPIQQEFVVESGHFEDDLTYRYFTDSEDGSRHDITNGRHTVDYDKSMPTVQRMLKDIDQYVREDHIQMKEPDIKRGQMVNKLQRLLRMFTMTKLEELHKKLSGEALTVFYHMLPLIGSKASVMFIKQLIVNKDVEDEIAAVMLQNLPEHVVQPTVELLSELEDLMRLDESMSWKVRKSGILSFAALIHKSHMFMKRMRQMKDTDHRMPRSDLTKQQQPFEKYMEEYINKVRSTQDRKARMAYTYALSNMKMPSIAERMLPAIRGEWHGDYHFRLMSLWAVGSAAIADSDPNKMLEVLWPIIVDTQEMDEMRFIAFCFFMQAKPNQSKVMNLLDILLEEPSEEFYSFVYTYLRDIAHANNKCEMELRVRVAELLQLLPVPTHGKSFVKIHDYRDLTFGFSLKFSHFLANGQHALLMGFGDESELFNIQHKGVGMYFKVHGIQSDGEPMNMLYDIFKKKNTNMLSNKEMNIEMVMFKHGRIINTFFFDENNMHEMDNILNFFTKESHSMSEKMMEISYNEFFETVIPTDLGFPAAWQYLMPVVHFNTINATKETVNKVMKLKIDNRYVSLIHYRHGLTFYNPIADIWQGINRYHTYDAMWPLRLEMSLNTQQRSMQISWEKHADQQKNIMGFRSHVKQMVFVKDDNGLNMLKQSSPQSKDFVIVTHGKQFRHDYMLSRDDDLSIGHQWDVAIFDSSRSISNGSFRHMLDLFTQSHPQTTETWMSHLFKSWANWHQYTVLLPDHGMYGIIARIEPSRQVSNIDLSLRLHSEPMTDDTHNYTPKLKWSTRATYSVKNQEKSLKTWDINTILDMNAGHTVNNLKMHITRIIPGQKDYKICVDGMKKWTQKGVDGHLTIAMSQTPDGKCVQDDTLIDVTMDGQRSEEQMDGNFKYRSCELISPYSVSHKHSMQCLIDHTTVRHYTFNVKTMNVPSEFKKMFARWWDTIKGNYMSYYMYEDEHNENIPDNTLKIDMVYPMQEEEVNIQITTPQHMYKLTGIPTHHWKWMNLHPDSLEYPKLMQFLHTVGYIDHCVVEPHRLRRNHRKLTEALSNDWTLYVGNDMQNPEIGVYFKQAGDQKLAMKVVDHGHTIEMAPHGTTQQISLDGQVVPITEYYQTEWVYLHMFAQDHDRPVAIMLKNSSLHMEYYQDKVIMIIPKKDQKLQGKCYKD